MTVGPNNYYKYEHCARCGSSVTYVDCWWCAQPGGPYPDVHCPEPGCNGHGNVPLCLSSADWCEANPIPGCETVERHTVEATDDRR